MLDPVLIIPDTHRPYHHQKAYRLMLEVAAFIAPKEIIILGDYADFYCVSSHAKHPTVASLLLNEVEDVILGLDEIDRAFPEANKVFLEGNHEYRLERYLVDKAPALFGITSVKHLFQFDRRPKWTFVKYGPSQMHRVLNSHLWARHEPLGPTAKASAGKAMCSFVHGHTHRIESAYSIGLKGDQHICFSPGWLGDQRKDEIFGYTKHHQQWSMGFSVVYVNQKTGEFYPQVYQIIDGEKYLSCSVNGRLFKI